MIIGIVQFPPIKPGKEKDFLDWFSWSNSQFRQQKGFISRRLIKNIGDASYVALLEFAGQEDLKRVSAQPFHAESAQRLTEILAAMPHPVLYEDITS